MIGYTTKNYIPRHSNVYIMKMADAVSGLTYNQEVISMHGSCEKCETSKCCAFSRKGMKFGMAFGIPNAIFMLALGWAGWLFGYGLIVINQSATLYQGFSPTFLGGIVGALWGFVLGFIFGYLFGIVLQCCSKCCGKCGPSSCAMPNTKNTGL